MVAGGRGSESCEACGGSTVVRPVPSECRGLFSDDPASIRLCETCLVVTPAPGIPVERDWNPSTVSDALPSDPDAAVALALGVTFFSSLAIHRSKLEEVVTYLERKGVDPLLAFDRIGDAPDLEPAVDLFGRRSQLAQLMAE